MTGYLALSWADLAAASLFLLLNAVLSIRLQLGLERQLMVSAARMVVQLLMIGLVLKLVFASVSPWLTLGLALIMVLFAGREVRARQSRPLAGPWGYTLGAGAMVAAGAIVTVSALIGAIGADPWWHPQYALPLFGMVLGNVMTGVSLGLETFLGAATRERDGIEARLLLGMDRGEAMRPQVQRAMRAGLTPIVNAMAATGVVSLPGMMTGQILSGVDPQEAVKYQLLIMFLLAGASGLGVLGAVLGAARRLTDARHRLRLDRLAPEPR